MDNIRFILTVAIALFLTTISCAKTEKPIDKVVTGPSVTLWDLPIPICFRNVGQNSQSAYDDAKALAVEALAKTWASSSGVHFDYQGEDGDCPDPEDTQPEWLVVELRNGGWGGRSGVGAGADCFLGIRDRGRIQDVAVHEVGHSLGLRHEHSRADGTLCEHFAAQRESCGVCVASAPCRATDPQPCACAYEDFSRCLGYDPAILGRPAVAVWGEGPQLAYRGSGNHLQSTYWEGGTWKRLDMRLEHGAPFALDDPAAYVFAEGPQLAYQGEGGSLQTVYWEGGTWNLLDLTQSFGAPEIAGSPSVTIWHEGPYLVYRGASNALIVVYYKSNQWQALDLTDFVKAPLIAGDPVTYVFGSGLQIVYRSSSGGLQSVYWDDQQWRKLDLTATTGAPNPVGDPSAYIVGSGPQIVYRSSGGALQSLSWQEGRWNKIDLTAGFGAPPAAGDPTSYVVGGRPQIVYRGTGDTLHLLAWDGAAWQPRNLTVADGAPPALGDPEVYLFGEGPQVVYRGQGGALHSVFWASARWNVTTIVEGQPSGTITLMDHDVDDAQWNLQEFASGSGISRVTEFDLNSIMNYCAFARWGPDAGYRVWDLAHPEGTDWELTELDKLGIEILYPRSAPIPIACAERCVAIDSGVVARSDGVVEDSWMARGAFSWWDSSGIVWSGPSGAVHQGPRLEARVVGLGSHSLSYRGTTRYSNTTVVGRGQVVVDDAQWTALVISGL